MQERLPATSLTGDFTVRLDSGQQYLLHERLLTDSSELLDRAVKAHKASAPGVDPVMHLPDVRDTDSLLLLHAKYASHKVYSSPLGRGNIGWFSDHEETKGTAWADAQGPSKLFELAAVSHALGCNETLALADQALVKQVHGLLGAVDALELCQQAQQLGLKGLLYEVAIGLVKLMPRMDSNNVARAADLVSSVLVAARSEMIFMLEHIEARNRQGHPHASQGGMLYRTRRYKANLKPCTCAKLKSCPTDDHGQPSHHPAR